MRQVTTRAGEQVFVRSRLGRACLALIGVCAYWHAGAAVAQEIGYVVVDIACPEHRLGLVTPLELAKSTVDPSLAFPAPALSTLAHLKCLLV